MTHEALEVPDPRNLVRLFVLCVTQMTIIDSQNCTIYCTYFANSRDLVKRLRPHKQLTSSIHRNEMKPFIKTVIEDIDFKIV